MEWGPHKSSRVASFLWDSPSGSFHPEVPIPSIAPISQVFSPARRSSLLIQRHSGIVGIPCCWLGAVWWFQRETKRQTSHVGEVLKKGRPKCARFCSDHRAAGGEPRFCMLNAWKRLLFSFGAVCLDVRTLFFGQLVGFPLNH